MISKISKLDKIAKFSSITQEKDFRYGGKGQNCNIVFGFNGSGKTTLSNAISFFADNSFISEDEKKGIYNDIKNGDDSVVELCTQGNSTIKYPANSTHSKNIYIFNSNFVATHVFNGTKGKLKKFSNIGGEIKNKEIDNINQHIEVLDEEKKKIETENIKLNEKFEEIKKRRSQLSKKLKGRSAWNKGIPRTKEVKEKISKKLIGKMVGEKSWNWKGGLSSEVDKVRNSLENKLWRKSVFERDNYTCQKCSQHGGSLEAHHIFNFSNYLELRFAINNGIVLCKKCHNFFHRKYGIKNNTKEQLFKYLTT